MKKILAAIAIMAMTVSVCLFVSCNKDGDEILDDLNTGIASGDYDTPQTAVFKITNTSNNPYTIKIGSSAKWIVRVVQ